MEKPKLYISFLGHETVLNLDGINLTELHTDDNIRQQARALVPRVLDGLAAAAGRATWEAGMEQCPDLMKGWGESTGQDHRRGPPGRKGGSNPARVQASQIQALGQSWLRKVTDADRLNLEEYLADELVRLKQLQEGR